LGLLSHTPPLTSAHPHPLPIHQLYEPFYEDFGPLNLGKTHKFVMRTHQLLQVSGEGVSFVRWAARELAEKTLGSQNGAAARGWRGPQATRHTQTTGMDVTAQMRVTK
jgi:hypothetical protein